MFSLLSALMVLLTMVVDNKGQQPPYGLCDYASQVVAGKKYYIVNTNYPYKYPRGSSCRWIATSDRPMKMTCDPFNVPASIGCLVNYLIVGDSNDARGHRWCGNGTFTVISKTNQLIITLTSSFRSVGGLFRCTIETQEPEPNCQCKRNNPAKIVGGEETGVNEYPMMAGIFDSTMNAPLCGATIINEKQVLTAAHCVANRSAAKTKVLIGGHNWSKVRDTNAAQRLQAESFLKHPRYNDKTSDYDIALITIQETIRFNQFNSVGPACLPFQHASDSFAGNYVTIVGWGNRDFVNGPSNTLQKARVSVISNFQCRTWFPQLTTRQICTQEPGKDSCQFDSGGPLLWENPSTRRVVLVGVISLGTVCADGYPAQNTRVGEFVNWIKSQAPPGIRYCEAE